MKNIEIAKLFNEEESLKQTVLENLANSNGSISIEYCIFAEDHTPLTKEQQKTFEQYGFDGVIRLYIDIDLNELIG